MNKLGVGLLALALVGCAGQQTVTRVQTQQVAEVNHELFGLLEKQGSTYSFTRISEQAGEGPWVRLSDMQPQWSLERESCHVGWLAEGELACHTDDESLFREKSVELTPGRILGHILPTVFTMGFALTTPPAAVKFGEAAYLKAVSEAKSKAGIDLADYLEQYDADMKRFAERYEDIRTGYDAVNFKTTIQVTDRSGLFRGGEESFRTAFRTSKRSIASVNQIPSLTANGFSAFASSYPKRNEEELKAVADKAAGVDVACFDDRLRNVLYRYSCPEFVPSSQGQVKVHFIVEGLDYAQVLPKSVEAEDRDIKLVIQDGYVSATNKSNSFVKIDSISFYHNKKIGSLFDVGAELPPGGDVTLMPANRIPLEADAIRFSGITKDKALRTQVEYGIAVKYRLVDSNVERTLLSKKHYRLLDLL